MDEDRLSPQLGRLIDAAKAAAASGGRIGPDGGSRGAGASEGWAVLGRRRGLRGGAGAAVRRPARAHPAEAAAFAVAGESGDTLLPPAMAAGAEDVDPSCRWR